MIRAGLPAGNGDGGRAGGGFYLDNVPRYEIGATRCVRTMLPWARYRFLWELSLP